MLLKRVLQNVPGNSQENICGRVFFNNVACYKPAKTDFFTSVFSVRICQDFSEQLFNTTFQLLFLSCFWNKEQPAFTFTSHPIQHLHPRKKYRSYDKKIYRLFIHTDIDRNYKFSNLIRNLIVLPAWFAR